jgi:hypothetical protein
MAMTNVKSKPGPTKQKACIDLPGEPVKCWRSSDKIQVVLRKHRDVIFDINLQAGVLYTVESTADFYSPKNKRLLRKIEFCDGEQCHIWVGREFQAKLVLKVVGMVLGTYEVNQLDTKSYGADPQTKPEPLMIIMGKKEAPGPFMCTPEDPFGIGSVQKHVKPSVNPKFAVLSDIGSEFDYAFPDEVPEVKEYVVVTEALPREIQSQVVAQLERNVAVVGSVGQIFVLPQKGDESFLLTALVTAAKYVSGSSLLTDNTFKETAGYVSEHFKMLDRIFASVRIEKRAKGAYQVAIKGYPVSKQVAALFGGARNIRPDHWKNPLGSKESEFMDGGYARTGKAGYGGFKRIMMTTGKNFLKGMKIQGIGTVIDLVVDAHSVFLDKNGSKDVSEFLGRAGVSIAKAGATAALGSVFAALGSAALAMVVAGALPVGLVVCVVVAGFVGAAMLVDMADDRLGIKESVAGWAR